jgi:hypothetical protein
LCRGLNFEVVVLVLHDGANCRCLAGRIPPAGAISVRWPWQGQGPVLSQSQFGEGRLAVQCP